MNPAPLVSICIPAYNQDAIVARALRSALSQSMPQIEVVAVDDKSTDSTATVLATFAGDERFRFETAQQNQGPAANHNRCLELARGEYVVFLHGDDCLAPEAAAKLWTAITSRDETVLAFGRRTVQLSDSSSPAQRRWAQSYVRLERDLIAREGTCSDSHHNWYYLRGDDVITYQARTGMRTNNIGEPSSVMVSAEVLRSVGGFRSQVKQAFDFDAWLRMLCRGDAVFIDDVVGARHLHAESLTEANMAGNLDWLDPVWVASALLSLSPNACWSKLLRRVRRRELVYASYELASGRPGPRLNAARGLVSAWLN